MHSPAHYFTLILMDMQMPVWDGLEAARQIRALPREDAEMVLIIAATANAFLEDETECMAAGMDDSKQASLAFFSPIARGNEKVQSNALDAFEKAMQEFSSENPDVRLERADCFCDSL